MMITRSERWRYDRGFDRDVCPATIQHPTGYAHGYLFDTPMLLHEFQRTAGERVPLLIDAGGDMRVAGYTWSIRLTREDLQNVKVVR